MSGLLRGLLSRGEPDAASAGRIRLVVGLGNPGEPYAHNRHNVGYWTVNRLARRHGIEFDVRTASYFLGEGVIAGHRVALAKPRTYMNRSGDAVWNLVKRLKLDGPSELLLVYDELDLPVGKVRIRTKGGPGGQKGVAHIIERLGTNEFPRVRIGIGRPVVDGQPTWDPDVVAAYVLSDPPPDERSLLDEAVARAVEAIEVAIAEGIEAAMNRFNR